MIWLLRKLWARLHLHFKVFHIPYSNFHFVELLGLSDLTDTLDTFHSIQTLRLVNKRHLFSIRSPHHVVLLAQLSAARECCIIDKVELSFYGSSQIWKVSTRKELLWAALLKSGIWDMETPHSFSSYGIGIRPDTDYTCTRPFGRGNMEYGRIWVVV